MLDGYERGDLCVSVNQKKEVAEDQQFYFMGRRKKGTAEGDLRHVPSPL